MLHLDKDAVASGGRKTIREFDSTRHRLAMLSHLHSLHVHSRMRARLAAGIGEHERSHRGGPLRMRVREHRSIRLDEGSMTGHPHIWLHISSRFAIGIQQTEAE